MAKQKSIVKLEGAIGDLTFFKTADGYLARETSAVSGKRIATDPSYQRTRENMSEFSRAGKAAKQLRDAIRTWLANAKDSKLSSRLTQLMMKVVKADKTSLRGLRNVIDGETSLLKSFEFNINSPLTSTLVAVPVIAIDRMAGTATVSMPAFIPEKQIVIPDGATHYKLTAIATALDFEAGTSVVASQETGYLPWNNEQTAPLTLVGNLTANTTHPIFVVLGIEFTQVVNGAFYSLKNGSFNSLKLVEVDPGA